MKYFEFKFNQQSNVKKESRLKELFYIFVKKTLALFLPKANPDFDSIYEKVVIWLIEYDDVKNYSKREVGLDENRQPIVKGPYKKNLGFWVDSNMTYEDFSKFNIQEIKQSCFRSEEHTS